MSRSSEIRSMRYRASRQRQQILQEAAAAAAKQEEGEEEDGDEDIKELESNNLLPCQEHGEDFNMHPFLLTAIRNSAYFRGRCLKISQFNEFVDEIYLKTTHLEPFENAPEQGKHPSERTASNAFCLLYRGFQLKLTRKQMQILLTHGDSPYIRAIGVLYLRYIGVPEDLWNWFDHLFSDHEVVTVGKDKTMKMSEWVESILEVKYFGTLFPRIPVLIERAIRGKLEIRKSEDSDNNNQQRPSSSVTKLELGTLVQAIYSEDKKWYDARIEELGDKPNTYWVTFLPEEEYGNQEQVSFTNIRLVKNEPLEEKPQQNTTQQNSKKAKHVPEGLTSYDDL